MCRARADRQHFEAEASHRSPKVLNRIFLGVIGFYQMAISPALPASCRFQPSCSNYAAQAFRKYPFGRAFWLSFTRILRCNPFCKGGYDPLP
ncbi:MAG: membrane protein insertion efficiency factor YidD [Candidatus Cloacimonadota bacterium]